MKKKSIYYQEFSSTPIGCVVASVQRKRYANPA